MNKTTLKERLDSVGFALFLIMLGVLWMQPEGRFPEDAWLVGFAAIIFVNNILRAFNGIKANWFFLLLAVIALAVWGDKFYGMDLSFFPVLFILIGISILWSALFKKEEKNCWDGCGWWKK